MLDHLMRKTKPAERSIIARRLRHAGSGWDNFRCRPRYRLSLTPQRNSFVKLNTGAAVNSGGMQGWRSSTADRVQKLYVNELEPMWGKRRLSEIGKSDVSSSYLDKIAVKHPQAAARRLRVIASFFNWCVAKGKLHKSPCDGIKMAKTRKRKRKLTDDELRWLWKACEKERFPMGYIVRLLILTLARRNEVSGIRDREVLLGNRRTWILPAPRTKNHNEHEIFMTDAMIETIKAVPRVKNKEGYFFTTNGKTPFAGFSKAKKRL